MIICNSSPLIALAIIDCLFILNKLKLEWCIPKAVFEEVTKKRKPYSEKLTLFVAGKVEEVKNYEVVTDLMLFLDKGESEVIQLALEKNASFVIIDDKRGRNISLLKGLQVVGTAGILLQAKDKGLIKAVIPLIKELKRNNIYFSDILMKKIMSISGEKNL